MIISSYLPTTKSNPTKGDPGRRINQPYTEYHFVSYLIYLIDANDALHNLSSHSILNQKKILLHECEWWTDRHSEQDKVKAAIEEAKNGNSSHFETTIENTKGETVYLNFSLTPVMNPEEKLIYYILEGRDVTMIKKAHQEVEIHKKELEHQVKIKQYASCQYALDAA